MTEPVGNKLKQAAKPVVLPVMALLLEKGPIARMVRNWDFPFRYLRETLRFFADMHRYARMKGAEPIRSVDLAPVFFQRGVAVKVDPHYFHAHIWAFSRLRDVAPESHVDVSSSYGFVGMLGCLSRVRYIEYNPPATSTENVEVVEGDLLSLPLSDGEVSSLSCLHAAEHVGLGRYGDPLDPKGTEKAAAELERVLAPGGELLFAVPVGRSRVQFNGQRIHSAGQIVGYFQELELVEYSGVDDKGRYAANLSLDALDSCFNGCGFFRFRKGATK